VNYPGPPNVVSQFFSTELLMNAYKIKKCFCSSLKTGCEMISHYSAYGLNQSF